MNTKDTLALFSNSSALLSGEHVRRPPSLLETKMLQCHSADNKKFSYPGSKKEVKAKGDASLTSAQQQTLPCLHDNLPRLFGGQEKLQGEFSCRENSLTGIIQKERRNFLLSIGKNQDPFPSLQRIGNPPLLSFPPRISK